MALPLKTVPRGLRLLRPASNLGRSSFSTSATRREEEWPQRIPLGAYYESILNQRTSYPTKQKRDEPPNTADPEVLPADKKPLRSPPTEKSQTDGTAKASSSGATPAAPTPTPLPTTAAEKAKIIFGTRLAGPEDMAARAESKKSRSILIGDVLVPPKPQEPDNCCMSGCVNCVWELYQEDVEDQEATEAGAPESSPKPAGVRVGEAKIAKDLWDDDLMQSVPVGFREFMKMEKKLKEKHARERSGG
uniref:Oxidoreductase-like domain-containing protein n=1 Tax=Bionectria ochroleuca TaxID=29856 RepID=A0A0B7KD61_BIOOC